MKAFFKKYLLVCGILANATFLYVGYKAVTTVFLESPSFPQAIHSLSARLQPHIPLASSLLSGLVSNVSAADYFPATFIPEITPERWPTVGPATTFSTDEFQPRETVRVSDANALLLAIKQAQPGQAIVISDGEYRLSGKRFAISQSRPTASNPIYLRSETPGGVTLKLDSLEGFMIDQPHWYIEGINFQGICAQHSRCDHALHIVGAASHTIIRNNQFYDFNAAIKVNQLKGQFPDYGIIERNRFGMHQPRETNASVTPINLDHGSGWKVRQNLIHDFIKTGGNKVSYGAYMKGGSLHGVFEQNLIICNTSQTQYPGSRVGLSFGGGGMHQKQRRDQAEFEVSQAVMRNNIILHCNDVGIYSQTAKDVTINNNILYHTAGIDVRFPQSKAEVYNNVMNGKIRERDGALSHQTNNFIAPLSYWTGKNSLKAVYAAPESGDFTLVNPEPLLDHSVNARRSAGNFSDYCGNPIKNGTAYLGAIYDSARCFQPSRLP